jgi:TPR repeat protein
VVTVADGDRAAEFYEIAAKQGDQEAMTALAALLRSGLTTRPDAPEAAVFWDNAAAQAREAAAGKTNP